MRAFVCIDGRDWETVIRGVARYLSEGEATLAHVVDERAPRGYELALRGLLGRRGRRSEESMASVSQMAAEELLADAVALLERLRPGLTIKTVALSGPPNEELMRAAEGAETVFVGRGTPGARPRATVSGVVRGWKKNPHGETDGLSLEDGVEVRFPPHKASEVRNAIGEGTPIEASGTWHGRHLHAYSITNADSGASVEAHKPPGEGPGKSPLGHTARFVVDHALCDVVILHL
jgi:nucleotide-binding universal stress UspA family protein